MYVEICIIIQEQLYNTKQNTIVSYNAMETNKEMRYMIYINI